MEKVRDLLTRPGGHPSEKPQRDTYSTSVGAHSLKLIVGSSSREKPEGFLCSQTVGTRLGA